MLQEGKEVPQSGQHTTWEERLTHVDGAQYKNKKGKIASHTRIIA